MGLQTVPLDAEPAALEAGELKTKALSPPRRLQDGNSLHNYHSTYILTVIVRIWSVLAHLFLLLAAES